MKLYTGQKWAYLEVTNIESKFMEVPDGPGFTIRGSFTVATLACNCGGTKEILVKDFPGQSNMKDCGCGKGADIELPKRGRPKAAEPKRLTSLFIEDALLERVREYGSENNLTMGRAVCELVSLGLASL